MPPDPPSWRGIQSFILLSPAAYVKFYWNPRVHVPLEMLKQWHQKYTSQKEQNSTHCAIAMTTVLLLKLKLKLCSSRKYPYPLWKAFSYYLPSALDFPKWVHKMDPLPSGNSLFVTHPLEILSFLVKTKNKLLLVQNTKFWSLTFFRKIWWILWPIHHQRVCCLRQGCIPQNLWYENYRFNTGNSAL